MKAFLIALLLTGCASIKGVAIDEDERKACEVEGCTVWTELELQTFAKKFWGMGYQAGKKSI